MSNDWPDSKVCECGRMARRKPLFTSFYYECWFCDAKPADSTPDPVKTEVDDYDYTKGYDPYAQVANSIYAPPPKKATHGYSIRPGDSETHFQCRGDTISVNGGPPFTCPVDGYYNITATGPSLI